MERFEPLLEFGKLVADDPHITPTHISVYIALLQDWMKNGGQNTLLVVRGEIMQSSKINSRNTYNKCMNQLDEFGYIRYYPSLDPYQPSRVVMKKLSATKNDNNGNR